MGLLKSIKKSVKSVGNHISGALKGRKTCQREGELKAYKNFAIGNALCGGRGCSRIPKFGGCNGKNKLPQYNRCNGYQRAQNQQQSNFLIRSYEKLVQYLMNLLNGQNDDNNNIFNQYNYYGNGINTNTFLA